MWRLLDPVFLVRWFMVISLTLGAFILLVIAFDSSYNWLPSTRIICGISGVIAGAFAILSYNV